jgi:Potassium-transporting ATPase A subunit
MTPQIPAPAQVTYAYASVAQDNGSAFAGLAANMPWYDTTLGLTMLTGRFAPIVLALAIAGSLAGARVHVHPGNARHSRADVHSLPARRDRDRRRPDLLPHVILGPIGERIVG